MRIVPVFYLCLRCTRSCVVSSNSPPRNTRPDRDPSPYSPPNSPYSPPNSPPNSPPKQQFKQVYHKSVLTLNRNAKWKTKQSTHLYQTPPL
ncbi:hypothetical protein Pmani_040036 [Petrolisthes manimaculis]|uniref:Uncharacterized protein n=1 Tax=Petrolisthes manimaculis TaxID=1843537 RepID=A0AAE1TKR4_9EUCA|nr:hypothetical protein Pmani_040036 [Petrolisthes manimaculis]